MHIAENGNFEFTLLQGNIICHMSWWKTIMLKAISRTFGVPKRLYSLVQEDEGAKVTTKHIVSGDFTEFRTNP
jgi:hypothetical protein